MTRMMKIHVVEVQLMKMQRAIRKKKTLQQTNESLQQHKIVYLPQRNGERDES